ncbi:MAG: diaminobutyrate--2-oxoglutarate transaminase [Alphaproteobacteria bacterium]|nr:diaminobutyrate--2-oxoglutarate transaminase [Alphaproteobacteria bacterium]
MEPFDRRESQVRSYCRAFPTVFDTARGCTLTDTDGRTYLDLFAGAGALSYGHNPPALKEALLAYLQRDGVTHALDMHTAAKAHLLEQIEDVILTPRGLDHRVLFPGPTGTNAVETCLKIARKVTGRELVVAFTNGFHGMTLGSLAITGSQHKRGGAGVPLSHTRVMPFDGYLGDDVDTIDVIARYLADGSSGVGPPAAFVVETVQAEGGVRVASAAWLRRLRALADEVGALLIVDDIQVGCGRTGPFFSFDGWDVVPDLIPLSKSLSGYGLPFSLVLVRPEHDVFAPGEHNGTFRGFNPAMVTAAAALDLWRDDTLQRGTEAKGAHARARLEQLARTFGGEVRGRGLILGLELDRPGAARAVSAACFRRGVIVETAGAQDEVLKLLPPLVISREELDHGLDVIAEACAEVFAAPRAVSPQGTGSEVAP